VSGEKVCSKREESKSISEFSGCRANRDGLQYQCKDCQAERRREYRLTDAGKKAHRRHDRSKAGRKRTQRSVSRYRKTPGGRAARARASANHRAKHPDRVGAREAIRSAVLSGHMLHVSTHKCRECNEQAQEYHHPDYSAPLDVVPLCRECHWIVDESLYQDDDL